jgi:hypothetical protein
VLLVLSSLLLVVTFWTVVGFGFAAPVVLSILGVARAGRDREGARRLTKIGWIIFGIIAVLVIAGITALIAWAASQGSSSSGFDTGYTALGTAPGVRA